MSVRPLVGEGRILADHDCTQPIHATSWLDNQVVFDHRRWQCNDLDLRWTARSHLLVLTEEGGTAHTQVRLDGRSVYAGQDRPGALTFVPAMADRRGTYRRADLTYTALWISPTVQSRLNGCEDLSLPAFVNSEDAVLTALLASLRLEVTSGRRPDAVYVEHLVAVCLLRLATLHGRPSPRTESHASLTPKVLNRVTDYIESNIGEDISLSDLAAVAGMPVVTFTRRFRSTIGIAPYAYVLERRVRRAEIMLRDTCVDISQIAACLGFSSQCHLTTMFRRITGITPRRYRKAAAPVG